MYQEISIIENNDKLTTRLKGIFEKEKDYKLTRLEERLNNYEREKNERNSEVSV